MPLRMRLIVMVGLVLLASMVCGGGLIGWHARKSVETELNAALSVGIQTVHNGFDDGAPLDRLVATFDGNRHVRASLLDAGRPVSMSKLLVPIHPAPDWFRDLIAGETRAERLAVPGGDRAILLQTDATNEVGEVWDDSRDSAVVLAGFAILTTLAISVTVGRALRPVEELAASFTRVGEGDYQGGVPESGPPELARLAKGFNRMAQRLAAAAAQNHRLNERLITLQAEERADLARDLHDEIGPLLFSVNMTAASIERGGNVRTHVAAIHDAIAEMQRHVRTLIERLRPLETTGLEAALERLVAFWRRQRPDIDCLTTILVDEERISSTMKETVYRVVQEALSNAIRHGAPARLEIAVTCDGADGVHVSVGDDGIGMLADSVTGRGLGQFGLIGMRERVRAMAGSLSIRPGHDGKGLTVLAFLPWDDSTQGSTA